MIDILSNVLPLLTIVIVLYIVYRLTIGRSCFGRLPEGDEE